MNIFKKLALLLVLFIFNTTISFRPVQAAENTIPILKAINSSSGGICSFAISSDGSLIAFSSEDKNIYIYDTSTGKQKHKLSQNTTANRLLFSPDGSSLFCGGVDDKVYIWDINKEAISKSLEGHTDVINSIDVSSDLSTLISVSNDKNIKMWDLAKGITMKTITFDSELTAVTYIPNDNKIAVATKSGNIELLDSSSGEKIKSIPNLFGDNSSIDDICCSSDGKYIIASSYSKAQPAILEVKNDFSIKKLDKDMLNGSWGKVSLTKDGQYIGSSNNGHSYIYDFNSGKMVNFGYASGKLVSFSNDSKLFLTLDKDSSNNDFINVYDSSKLQLRQLKSISITPSDIALDSNEERAVQVIAHYSDGSTEDITSKINTNDWISPNIDIAYVNTDKATINAREKEGKTVITAKYKDLIAAVSVQVQKSPEITSNADGDAIHVQVGKGGVIKNSLDGLSWNEVKSGTLNNLNKIIWNGFEFVAVGDKGTVLTSTNGAIWISRESNTGNDLNDVKWNTSSYCFAVAGKKGTLLRSLDGVKWEPVITSTTEDFDRISLEENKFLVSGKNSFFNLKNDDIKVLKPKLQESSSRQSWKIKFTRPVANVSSNSIEIYDNNGAKIEKTVSLDTSDNSTLVIKPSKNLEKGIYLIEVRGLILNDGKKIRKPVYMMFKIN